MEKIKVVIFSSVAGILAAAFVVMLVYNEIINRGPWIGISFGFGIVIFFIVFNTFMLAFHLKNKF